jgi:molecular chaperone IbpA
MNANAMDTVLKHSVGLDPRFFERNAANKFPPHNITHIGKDKYRLTLAVAGFTRTDLSIILQGELLTIRGSKETPSQIAIDGLVEPEHVILYRGIAYRDFSREFMIGEHVIVESAKLEHGLLEIDLIRQIPDIQKAKEIQISA